MVGDRRESDYDCHAFGTVRRELSGRVLGHLCLVLNVVGKVPDDDSRIADGVDRGWREAATRYGGCQSFGGLSNG